MTSSDSSAAAAAAAASKTTVAATGNSTSDDLPLAFSDGLRIGTTTTTTTTKTTTSTTDLLTDLDASAPVWAQQASERLKLKQLAISNAADTTNNANIANTPKVPTTRVLLHSCCAPCSGAMVDAMVANTSVAKVTVFFYNPNIHPLKEYLIRKEENKIYCNNIGVEFIDVDYDVKEWYKRMKGMELDPERGHRCTECFDMRMERTALYAHEHNYQVIATTNATSRWKDVDQVDESGFRAAARYNTNSELDGGNGNGSNNSLQQPIQYWASDWQSDEMTLRKYKVSADQKFYKQEYCGCSYSLRDSNDWRAANGIPKIQIGGDTAGLGDRYFSDPVVDAAEEAQDVVDEFFQQANELAGAGKDRAERKKRLAMYKDRRKNEKNDGVVVQGLNNW